LFVYRGVNLPVKLRSGSTGEGFALPTVVVAMHNQHYIMLGRNLLYTAVTRGKRLVVLIGSRRAMAQAAQTDLWAIRYGRLKEHLMAGPDQRWIHFDSDDE